jgi:hypothetical protein
MSKSGLSDLSKTAGYDLSKHNKVLEFVIKKDAWDLSEINKYSTSLINTLKSKNPNLKQFNIIITEF